MALLSVTLLLIMTVLRAVFMLVHADYTQDRTIADGLMTIVNGGAIDLSATMLLMVVPWVLIVVSSFCEVGLWWRRVLNGYLWAVTGVLSAVFAADLTLFAGAGHRLDTDALTLFADTDIVSIGALFRTVAIWIASWLLSAHIMKLAARGTRKLKPVKSPKRAVLPLAVMFACIIIGSGWGSGRIPRYGAAYFSSDAFMNASAINPTMSLVESALVRHDYSPMEILAQREKPTYEQPQPADSLSSDSVELVTTEPLVVDSLVVDSLPKVEPRAEWRQMVGVERPNVLMIVMNGITHKDFDRAVDGRYVMSHLNTLCSEGYLFENFYAASKGIANAALVAVTSGYITLPHAANQDIPFKCERMTTLTAMLDSAGYHTEAWYGGDLLHNNMRAYLYGTGFDNVVDRHKLRVQGVMRSMDDAVVLPLMTERILECEEPFFGVYMTNGMESGRLPYTKYDDARTNASAFIDEQIGVMVRRLKYGGAWDNLLIVVVGDSDGSEVRVPMMMVGGAVEGFGVIAEIGSQTDLPVTLARQMGLDASKFPYGCDLAADGEACAYYTFDGGYGTIDEQGASQYHFGQRYVESDPALKMRRYRAEEFLWGAYDELSRR
jgi:phosphoglycerol transferase MdoB-like AlkP superfamily enzyme